MGHTCYSSSYIRSSITYNSYMQNFDKYGITIETTPLGGGCAENPAHCCPPECPMPLESCKRGLYGRGLLYYRKWWERQEADIFVNGHKISGMTIFTDENTLRVLSDNYSYFIPLEKIDFIRRLDGPA